MAKTYQCPLPAPTNRGDVRPMVGGVKFTVGNVKNDGQAEMERRLQELRDLFDRQCAQSGIDRWAGWLLPFAKQVANGQPLIFQVHQMSRLDSGSASEDAIILDRLRALGVSPKVNDEATIKMGERQLQAWIDERIRFAVEDALKATAGRWGVSDSMQDRIVGQVNDPASLETRTFHDALKAYRTFQKAHGKKQDNGKVSPSVANYIRMSEWLAKTFDDFPLHRMDKTKLEELIAHWRNRPVSDRTGDRLSWDRAKHLNDALWSVLTWLDASDSWKWQLPKGASKIKRTPIKLDADRQKKRTRRIAGSIYKPDELAIIADELDNFGKLILGVSVNCAMQPAEVGRVEVGDFFTTHPETGEVGDWIIFDRPKTGEYGEWRLWPEVAELVKWGISRVQAMDAKGKIPASYHGLRLVVGNNGKPWYREDWTNPSTRFNQWWQANPTATYNHIGVVTRLSQKLEDFPRHTIKTLRKILPQMVRPKYGKEIADLVNARVVDATGRQGGRDTDRYADRLYDEATKAISELEATFRPMLDRLQIAR